MPLPEPLSDDGISDVVVVRPPRPQPKTRKANNLQRSKSTSPAENKVPKPARSKCKRAPEILYFRGIDG